MSPCPLELLRSKLRSISAWCIVGAQRALLPAPLPRLPVQVPPASRPCPVPCLTKIHPDLPIFEIIPSSHTRPLFIHPLCPSRPLSCSGAICVGVYFSHQTSTGWTSHGLSEPEREPSTVLITERTLHSLPGCTGTGTGTGDWLFTFFNVPQQQKYISCRKIIL